MGALILSTVLAMLVMMFILMFLHAIWPSVWYCKNLGWHIPAVGVGSFNGCSFASECKFCHEPILQDSQGNWF